jgi:hypothetical protein
LDVRKFFASIHHDVLKQQLDQRFKETTLKACFYQIIDSYESAPDRGLPIGNLTSQYFANHYLSGLDHFIKDELGTKGYVRYMDDMVIWGDDKASLLCIHKAIRQVIEEKLLMQLKPCQLNRTKLGLPFLGYRVFPYHSRLLQKSKIRFIHKLKRVYENMDNGKWDERVAQAHTLPLLAFTQYAEAKSFQKSVLYHLDG